jgi:hypothetical protein
MKPRRDKVAAVAGITCGAFPAFFRLAILVVFFSSVADAAAQGPIALSLTPGARSIDISVVVLGFGFGMTTRWFVFRLDFATVPLEQFGTDADIGDRDHKVGIALGVPLR